MRSILLLSFILALGAIQCKGPEELVTYKKTEEQYRDIKKTLFRFAALMEGDFSNAQQYEESPNASVRVDLHIRQIWPERSDAIWLYVEQVSPAMPSEPLSQRIYKITQPSPDAIESEMLYFENMKNYVGAWKLEAPLKEVKIASLELLESCTVKLNRLSKVHFKGNNEDCTEPLGLQIDHTSLSIDLRPNELVTEHAGYAKDGREIFKNTTVFDKR